MQPVLRWLGMGGACRTLLLLDLIVVFEACCNGLGLQAPNQSRVAASTGSTGEEREPVLPNSLMYSFGCVGR